MIYLDSCLVIYALEDEGARGDTVRDLLTPRSHEFAISPLVKLECLVGPMRAADLVMQKLYENGLSRFNQLPMSESVFVRAAELRGRSNISTPDALHLAAAQIHKCDALWTNDARLTKVSHGLAVGVLEDLA